MRDFFLGCEFAPIGFRQAFSNIDEFLVGEFIDVAIVLFERQQEIDGFGAKIRRPASDTRQNFFEIISFFC